MKEWSLRAILAVSCTSTLLLTGYGMAQEAPRVGSVTGAVAASADQDKKIVSAPNASRKARVAIPKSVSVNEKKQINRLIARSIAATRAGRGDEAVRGIEKLRVMLKDNDGEDSPWQTCGAMCQHHLDEGNAPFYATCYWACVIRGGPSARPTELEQPGR